MNRTSKTLIVLNVLKIRKIFYNFVSLNIRFTFTALDILAEIVRIKIKSKMN